MLKELLQAGNTREGKALPTENKPKQEHTETQSNQTDKNEKQR